MKKLSLSCLLLILFSSTNTHAIKLPTSPKGSIITAIALCTIYGMYRWFKPTKKTTTIETSPIKPCILEVSSSSPFVPAQTPDYIVNICIPRHGFNTICSKDPGLASELSKRGFLVSPDEFFIPILETAGAPMSFPDKLPLKLLLGQTEGRVITFSLDKNIVGIQLSQYEKNPKRTITFQDALNTACSNSHIKIEHTD
jgi:hypothetical protein